MKTVKSNYKKVSLEESVQIRVLHQKFGMGLPALQKQFQHLPKTTIYRHSKKPLGGSNPMIDKRHGNQGRPRKLSSRDERSVIRALHDLREKVGTFSSTDIQEEAGLQNSVHNRTVRRCLKRQKYGYFQCRKKGLLLQEDLKRRLNFAKRCKKLPANFWTEGVSFYLDGTSWAHKMNPCKQAKTRRTRMWRKRGEGLKKECSAKGKKEGTGGKMAKFMVAIAHGKGVIACYQYMGSINGEKFAEFIEKRFPGMFERGNNVKGKLFLQDGDPSQNCKLAQEAMDKVPCRLFKIPPRSPDLNPIENVFHLVGQTLRKDAQKKDITKETFEMFSERVKRTLLNFPSALIDSTIESMDRRLDAVIKNKGLRTKY